MICDSKFVSRSDVSTKVLERGHLPLGFNRNDGYSTLTLLDRDSYEDSY